MNAIDSSKVKIHSLSPLSDRGYLLAPLPKPTLDDLGNIVQTIKDFPNTAEPFNKYLAGQINKEYHIKDIPPSLVQNVWEALDIYDSHFTTSRNIYALYDFEKTKTPPPISLSTLWVNYQQKYEYNPVHSHSGLYSFVIWYSIPYDIDNEKKYGPGKDKVQENFPQTNFNGCFSFLYSNPVNGSIENEVLPVDKSWNGVMSLFPSTLSHAVYPFYTSDDYRITISGNIYLKS